MNYRSLAAYGGLIVAAVALDQWIKRLVETGLVLHEKVDVVPFLALYRTYNTGVAFSMFEWVGDKGLMIMSVAVIAFVLFLAKRTEPSQVMARIGFCLIIGGAIGNLIDRIRSSQGVVDFIDVGVGTVRWPVFNVADMAVTIGAIILALSLWKEEQRVEGAP